MLILLLICGGVCAFGLLSVFSNERFHRVQSLENRLRAEADAAAEAQRPGRKRPPPEEILTVGSPIPHAALAEEPIPVR
jgi:hypothetical protein